MNEFPFEKDEWDRLTQLVYQYVTPILNDQDPDECALPIIQSYVEDLKDKYGDHPILIETEADFESDVVEQNYLYEKATKVAIKNGLPTLSIRLSHARLKLHDLKQKDEAKKIIEECREEMLKSGDEYDKEEWQEILKECDS